MGQVFLTAICAYDQLTGLQRIMRSTSIPAAFRMLSLW
jgi:hypothetical protein